MTTILTIDDDPAIRKFLQVVLSREGFDIVAADDGRMALEQLQAHPIDLVVTDIFMPEKDGLEFIREMRLLRPNVKVIAISGGTEYFDPGPYLSIAKMLGAVTILGKPIQRDKLVQTIDDLLAAELEIG